MSIDTCHYCTNRVDTDYDLDCYRDVGETFEKCVCERCRERYGMEFTDEQDGVGTLPTTGG